MTIRLVRGSVCALLMLYASEGVAGEWRTRRGAADFIPPETIVPLVAPRSPGNGFVELPLTPPNTTLVNTPPPIRQPPTPGAVTPAPQPDPGPVVPAPSPLEAAAPAAQTVRVIEADSPFALNSPLPRWCELPWEFHVGTVWWGRTDSDSVLVSGANPVRGHLFDVGFQLGCELGIVRHLDGCEAWEGRYVGVDDWHDSTTVTGGAGQINVIPPIAIGAFTLTGTFGAELHSAELNYRRNFECGTWLVGVRHFELDEGFDATIGAIAYRVRTTNGLYGVQVGYAAEWLGPAWDSTWRLSAQAKGGAYYNHATQGAVLDATNIADTSDVAAFAGEATLRAEYALACNCSVYAGYQLLWLSQVALAMEQIPATNVGTQSGIEDSGNVVFHGIQAGVMWLW